MNEAHSTQRLFYIPKYLMSVCYENASDTDLMSLLLFILRKKPNVI